MKNLSRIIGRNISLVACLGLLAGGVAAARAQTDLSTSSPYVAPAEPQVHFSPGIRDVLKMIDAKVGGSVVIAYIRSSPTAYNPSASEIIALKQRGVPDEIITTLIQRGAEVRAQIAQSAQMGAQATPPAGMAPYANGYGATVSDQAYPDYGDYGYGYPYSGYPYYAGYPYYGYPYNYWWYSSWYPWGFYSPFYFGYYGHRFHGFYGRGGFDRFGHSFARGTFGVGNRGAWAPARGGFRGFAPRSFSGARTAGFVARGGSFAGRSGGFGGHGGFGGGGHGGGHR